MRRLVAFAVLLTLNFTTLRAQDKIALTQDTTTTTTKERKIDANNPIDPAPTLGLFERAYGNNKSKLQFIGNVTFDKWLVRVAAEEQFNYGGQHEFKGASFLVSRLFKSKDEKHKFGFGAVVSQVNNVGWAAGGNIVSVSEIGKWKVISLLTLQGGDDIFSMEFQPGLYRNFNKGWYMRSHPRMLWDFKRNHHEIPVGLGMGKIFDINGNKLNLLLEPQWDFWQNTYIIYTGVKFLFK